MDNKTVLITGASAGIGRALALEFARAGHDLILVARSVDKLRDLAETLRVEHGVKVVEIPMDISKHRAARELEVGVRSRDLQVDVLVNNAGVAEAGPFSELDSDALHRMVQLNVGAVTQLISVFLPGMLERGDGRIMNVASVAGFQPVVGLSVYAATKAYVLSMTEALAEELRGTGVSVTALCPGITATDMADQIKTGAMGDTVNVPKMLFASAESVAAEGYQACMRREVLRVPGMMNRLGTYWSQVQPRWLVRTLGGVVGRQFMMRR